MTEYAKRKYEEITDIRDQKKLHRILEIIPEDVKTIIDIGCGNGLMTNELGKTYDILGVDINKSKLQYVTVPHLQASCDAIPKPAQSFDLVFSSEMIEHLPDELFLNTLKEFERLSRKYILITVPNREPLYKLTVKCNQCDKTYHKNGHLQRFNKESIISLFPDWQILALEEFGKPVRSYKKFLADIKHQLAPAKSWIPAHWIKTQGVPYHFCIHCGHKNELKPHFHPVSFAADSINTLLSSRHPSHLMILLQRKTA
jgi:SAM-dependent methyltransferase